MKKARYKIVFGLTNKIFIGLLTGLVNESNYTKCMLLSNQKCMTQSTLINLHSKEYRQEFQYYPFAVYLDKCAGSFNTLNDLSNKVCVPNKTGDLNRSVSNMITGMNASKTLTNIYNANVNVGLMEENLIQINGGTMINVNLSLKNITYVKKTMFGIYLQIFVKMENI